MYMYFMELIHPMYKLYKHVHVDVHGLHGRLIHPMYKLYKHVHVDVHGQHGRLIHPKYKLYPQSVCIYEILRPSETLTSSNRLPHTLTVGRNTCTFTPPPPLQKTLFYYQYTKCGISISQRFFNWHKSFTTPFSNILLGAFFSRGERELPVLTCGGSITSAPEPVGAYVDFFFLLNHLEFSISGQELYLRSIKQPTFS